MRKFIFYLFFLGANVSIGNTLDIEQFGKAIDKQFDIFNGWSVDEAQESINEGLRLAESAYDKETISETTYFYYRFLLSYMSYLVELKNGNNEQSESYFDMAHNFAVKAFGLRNSEAKKIITTELTHFYYYSLRGTAPLWFVSIVKDIEKEIL